jgi:hypothetical protein
MEKITTPLHYDNESGYFFDANGRVLMEMRGSGWMNSDEEQDDTAKEIETRVNNLTRLQSENERLKSALEQIAEPIGWMQKNLKEGERLDGGYAIMLSNDANYLKGIARAALNKVKGHCP